MTPEEKTLIDLQVAVARLEERLETVIHKLDQAMVSRHQLEERLAPLASNIDRWKGGLAMLAVTAGVVGSLIGKLIHRIIEGPP